MGDADYDPHGKRQKSPKSDTDAILEVGGTRIAPSGAGHGCLHDVVVGARPEHHTLVTSPPDCLLVVNPCTLSVSSDRAYRRSCPAPRTRRAWDASYESTPAGLGRVARERWRGRLRVHEHRPGDRRGLRFL